MALGAVFLSLPLAMFFALYGYAVERVSATHGLLVYAAIGTAILISFTLLHGLKVEDFR